MITGNDTTVDWQNSSTDILVFPVGAFEQHDAHLPLCCDIIHAEFFGNMIAEKFDAALLPVQNIATSMEHTGFRGSFSLKPETLMQIIRDIADEAENQKFSILIIINGHGGNHCLLPVCRDINRRDRKIKIILVAPAEFAEKGITESSNKSLMDFHAGESETSRMLIEKPELVRKSPGELERQKALNSLHRNDLTTFGIGHFNKNGSVGSHHLASTEKGRKLIESISKNMLVYLADRIERLRRYPQYSGRKEQ